MVILLTTLLLLASQVIDGDTYVFPDLGKARLEAYDTPELAGKCPEEIALAARAKAYAAEFLSVPVLVQHDGKRDRYGRVLVRITRGTRDLGEELRAAGLARAYEGRRRSWCN